MSTLYGDSIFESTDSIIAKLTESINNDFALFDGLLNESVINEGVKEVFHTIVENIKKFIQKIKDKIAEIKTKYKNKALYNKWSKALKNAGVPITIKYANTSLIISDYETFLNHANTLVNMNPETTDMETIDNYFHNQLYPDKEMRGFYTHRADDGHMVHSEENAANRYLMRVTFNNEAMVDGFINGKLKDYIKDLSSLDRTFSKCVSTLNGFVKPLEKMQKDLEKSQDHAKAAKYKEIAEMIRSCAHTIKDIVSIITFAMVPHIEKSNYTEVK